MELKEYIKQYIREILNEENNLKIISISTGRDSGMARGAIGNYYNLKLSNGKTVEVSDDEFLDRYHELRNLERISLEKLNKILIGKEWKNLDEESSSGDVGAYSTPFAFAKKGQKKNKATSTAEREGMKLAPEGIPSDSKIVDYKVVSGPKKKKYKLYKEGEMKLSDKVISSLNYIYNINRHPEYKKAFQEIRNWIDKNISRIGEGSVGSKFHNELKPIADKLDISPEELADYINTEIWEENDKYLEESDYDKASPYTAASEYGKESGYTKASPSSNPSLYLSEKEKNMKESLLMNMIKQELLNEVTYSKFKNEVKYRTKNEQLHKAIREVKRKLMEIDRIVEYTSRMKQELSEGEEGIKYWKATEKNVGQIAEMMTQLNNKIKNLNQ